MATKKQRRLQIYNEQTKLHEVCEKCPDDPSYHNGSKATELAKHCRNVCPVGLKMQEIGWRLLNEEVEA